MKERFSKFNDLRTTKLRERDNQVDGPRDMLESQEIFAKPVEHLVEILAQGVSFEQSTHYFADGTNFTNRYKVTLEGLAANAEFDIAIRNIPTHIQRQLVNDESVVVAASGGFFFLVDEMIGEVPKEMAFGTLIRDGILLGVQSHDRPVLWVDLEDDLKTTEVSAKGRITIGDTALSWAGRHSSQENTDLRLFGVDSCVIEHVDDPETGKKRIMNKEKSRTPETNNMVDVVCERRDSQLVVSDISEGGGTSVLAGNFVLQGRKSLLQAISMGDTVNITYDDLDITAVKSAITIGPAVSHFDNNTDHPINHDKSLGNNPPFTDCRTARSIVYKTIDGDILFEVFDGAPKTEAFKGVSPKEVGDILKQDGIDIEWAYFLDPGQSARLAVRHSDGSIKGFGNSHYIRWPNLPDQPYVWAGEHGRPVPSLVSVKIKKND